jgi:predicted translin family RNA/ssDNA-binding protein
MVWGTEKDTGELRRALVEFLIAMTVYTKTIRSKVMEFIYFLTEISIVEIFTMI